MRYLKSYELFEDVDVDKSNLQRLKDQFEPHLDDLKSKLDTIEQIVEMWFKVCQKFFLFEIRTNKKL